MTQESLQDKLQRIRANVTAQREGDAAHADPAWAFNIASTGQLYGTYDLEGCWGRILFLEWLLQQIWAAETEIETFMRSGRSVQAMATATRNEKLADEARDMLHGVLDDTYPRLIGSQPAKEEWEQVHLVAAWMLAALPQTTNVRPVHYIYQVTMHRLGAHSKKLEQFFPEVAANARQRMQ